MNLLLGTTILCLLATAPAYARQNQDDKQQETTKAPEKNDKNAEKPGRSPEKPVDKPSKPPKEDPVTTKSESGRQEDQQQKQADQQAKSEQKAQQNEEKERQKQAKNQEKQQQQSEREVKNQRNDNHGHADRADNAARGDEGGRRIPEDRYRADFGRAHTFRVRHDNDRRFQFGGYWFEYTDPWPSDWSDDDEFYIVEIDDVDYLCDARFPDERIVVIIAR